MSDGADRPWGRVDDEGNIYLRTGDGEKFLVQVVDGSDPGAAVSLFERKYEGLVVEVELLEKRLESGTASPDDVVKASKGVRESIEQTHAIGDIDALYARLDALEPAIEKQRELRKQAKAERAAASRETKERISADAEKIAAGNDWKNGADKLRALLDEWKQLPHLDKKSDDALWHRFSAARSAYTKRRRAHFAELGAKRDEAARIKEKLIVEAEALSGSTEFGPTAGKYRDLMQRWKKAGPAPRNVEGKLWDRFRAAQDAFFAARDAHNAQVDAEFEANAEVKEKILLEAEALLPIDDLETARKAWHDIADRWEAAGKVPRAKVKSFESRIRTVERAIRDAEDAAWNQSNPELSARADATVTLLQQAIDGLEADLAKAEAAGNAKKVKEITESIEARRAWLDQALKARDDLG